MKKEFVIKVLPEIAGEEHKLYEYLRQKAGLSNEEQLHVEILRSSIDARSKQAYYNLKVRLHIGEEYLPDEVNLPDYSDVSNAKEVIVIGAGPAGLFAALELMERGLKPVLIERGKNANERIKDLKAINVRHEVNEDSNYCFGEGGAGTYSDGKLYTRSKKRGNVAKVLEILVGFGAVKDILVDSHPHIGTNKLPGIIANMRECIIQNGGDIHFDTRVTDLIIDSGSIRGVKALTGENFYADRVILATGHSARDIFRLLQKKGIAIELKPLAIGVRVEHPQSLIDTIQYNCDTRGEYLPPASYSMVKQTGDRGVYSFCMCPGGVIAPCATSPGEIVTNGWSSSRRARSTANSGIVVELKPRDFKQFQRYGPLAAMEFQHAIEVKAWKEGGKTQTAPAQLLKDFVDGKVSESLPNTSYAPGITSVDLRSVLPKFLHNSLKDGFRQFDRSMKGYLTNDAVVHAPETRTSSPVKIPRDEETLQHIQIEGLYPCGEGAGYAGGIVSAAMDGIKCAKAVSFTTI